MEKKAKYYIRLFLLLICAELLVCIGTGQWAAFWISAAALMASLLLFSWLLLRFSLDSRFRYSMISFSDYTSERRLAAFGKDQIWFIRNASSVSLTSHDSLQLYARFLPNPAPAARHRYVIVVHGYGNAADDAMCMYTRGYYELGFSVLCPSLRTHGSSEGRWMTMGYQEKRDILDWAAWIEARDPEAKIVLTGVSMGAASVMMCADAPDPHLQGIIEDCGYTSVWDEFAWQLKSIFGLPPFPILYLSALLAFLFLRIPLGQISSIQALQKSKVPVLFIHGEQDRFVPFWMQDQNYEACVSRKEKTVIPDAGHAQSLQCHPDLYWKSVTAFLHTVFPDIPPSARPTASESPQTRIHYGSLREPV